VSGDAEEAVKFAASPVSWGDTDGDGETSEEDCAVSKPDTVGEGAGVSPVPPESHLYRKYPPTASKTTMTAMKTARFVRLRRLRPRESRLYFFGKYLSVYI
jgi:hypothetical protein